MIVQEIHLETIPPHAAPGGIWVRVCTFEQLLTEYALFETPQLEESVDTDATLATDALDRGETVWTYFYDGDSGVCMRTIIAEPHSEFEEADRGRCPYCQKKLTRDGTTLYCEDGCF